MAASCAACIAVLWSGGVGRPARSAAAIAATAAMPVKSTASGKSRSFMPPILPDHRADCLAQLVDHPQGNFDFFFRIGRPVFSDSITL